MLQTRDDSQRRFLRQHNVAMLEKCGGYSKQRGNNVAMLCCTKSRRCDITLKRQIRHFQVLVMQKRAKKCTNKVSVMHVQSCCFAYRLPVESSRCRPRRLVLKSLISLCIKTLLLQWYF